MKIQKNNPALVRRRILRKFLKESTENSGSEVFFDSYKTARNYNLGVVKNFISPAGHADGGGEVERKSHQQEIDAWFKEELDSTVSALSIDASKLAL
ncbi:hypothetical protein [Spongiibacter marinus]|uniref:hypothetical protein n=1 Tax=Spongiibacter marinus TaxID=354246 RepID=UPI0035BE6F61